DELRVHRRVLAQEEHVQVAQRRVQVGEDAKALPHRAHARAGPAGLPAEPFLPQLAYLVPAAQAFRHQRERGVVPGPERFERIAEKSDVHPAKLGTAGSGRLPAQTGLRKSAPKGGKTSSSDFSRPWHALSCARTAP